MIPATFIQTLLSRVDIVEVIGQTVPLKRAGRSMIACCPFHREKTPSFSVSPTKQIFKCFGCGAAGDAIGFVMRSQGLSYPEAVRWLAARAGLEVPEDARDTERRARSQSLSDLMGRAADFYRRCLSTRPEARRYLSERGVGPEAQERYALGFAPDDWQALRGVFEDYGDAALAETAGCGLVIDSGSGRRYDRFRGRLMFPIRNRRGQVIGFGARTLKPDEQPKYLNSPETPIYHKGREIYGLYEAGAAIRERGRVIVTEGYLDVIQLAQRGFPETVAALGTSLTPEHARQLLKLSDRVYFCFDGDAAGQKALRRALEACLPVAQDGQEIFFVSLPPEHDPDSFVRERGGPAFEAELKGALTLSAFLVRCAKEGCDAGTMEGRGAILRAAQPLVTALSQAPALRGALLRELAVYYDAGYHGADDLARLFGLAAAGGAGAWDRSRQERLRSAPGQRLAGHYADKILLYLLCFPALCAEFSGRIGEEFGAGEDELSRQVVEVWRAALPSGREPVERTQVLLAALADSPWLADYQRLLGAELMVGTDQETARREVVMAFERRETEHVKYQIDEASRAPDPDLERISRLRARYAQLRSDLRALEREAARASASETP